MAAHRRSRADLVRPQLQDIVTKSRRTVRRPTGFDDGAPLGGREEEASTSLSVAIALWLLPARWHGNVGGSFIPDLFRGESSSAGTGIHAIPRQRVELKQLSG